MKKKNKGYRDLAGQNHSVLKQKTRHNKPYAPITDTLESPWNLVSARPQHAALSPASSLSSLGQSRESDLIWG